MEIESPGRELTTTPDGNVALVTPAPVAVAAVAEVAAPVDCIAAEASFDVVVPVLLEASFDVVVPVLLEASFDVVVPVAADASFEVLPESVFWPAAVISCVEPTAVASLRVVVSVPVASFAALRAFGSSEPACSLASLLVVLCVVVWSVDVDVLVVVWSIAADASLLVVVVVSELVAGGGVCCGSFSASVWACVSVDCVVVVAGGASCANAGAARNEARTANRAVFNSVLFMSNLMRGERLR